jgi:CRISPR-associated protein Csc2
LNEDEVIVAATTTIQALMEEEFIVHTDFIGDRFTPVLNEVKTLIRGEEGMKSILQQADAEAKEYAKTHIKTQEKKGSAKSK